MPTIRPNMVAAAARSVRAFGGEYLTREQADDLLRRWGHRSSLTGDEAQAVLEQFTPADVTFPAHDGHRIGRRGGSR